MRTPFSFLVKADAIDQDRIQVAACPGLPIVGDTTISGYGMCVGKRGTRREQNPLYWDFECEFSTEVEEGTDPQTPQQQGSDPTAWIPTAELQFKVMDEVVRRDKSTIPKLWQNSAKSMFETGLTIPRTILRRDFYQFEPITTTIDQLEDRNNKINDATFLGRDAKTLLLQIRAAKIGYYYGTRCWLVEYSMKYKEDDWRIKMLDVGYSYLDGSSPRKRKPYMDDDKQTIILGGLDGFGNPVDNQETDPEILYFERYETMDFSSFIRLKP
ncbi:MAG: hypothetical protein ACTHK7_12820 [Aureliella sp.]